MLDCCYRMELVEGEAIKFGALPRPKYLIAMRDQLVSAGIGYVEDASVFHANDQSRAKFIDFGTREPRDGPQTPATPLKA